jgi:hypothetical protein
MDSGRYIASLMSCENKQHDDMIISPIFWFLLAAFEGDAAIPPLRIPAADDPASAV